MKSESAELVSGLIRQYRRLRLLYLGYLAAAVLALVFFFVDKRVTLALVAASLATVRMVPSVGFITAL